MTTQALVFPAAAIALLFAACGADASDDSNTSTPTAGGALASLGASDLVAVWPEAGSKVHSTFDMVVGIGEMQVPGQIVILASNVESTTVATFEPGKNHGAVTLPAGQQSIIVQVLDEEGQSLGSDMSHKVSYDVVAAPSSSRVFFVEPADGATVKSPFKVVFGVEGMGMSPAMENMADKTVGHHHILINGAPMFASLPIPNNETHLHFGKAQTETEVTLKPGDYTLTMQFADGNHRSYGPRLAATIKVTVE